MAARQLKINKACYLGSISVLPPRFVNSSPFSSHRSRSRFGHVLHSPPSLLHSQSQLSQDENLLALHLLSPSRDQVSEKTPVEKVVIDEIT